MCFVSSRNNIADALSHLTKIPASQGYIQDEDYVWEVTLQAVPVALRIEEIEEASTQVEDLRVVMHVCRVVTGTKCLRILQWYEMN